VDLELVHHAHHGRGDSHSLPCVPVSVHARAIRLAEALVVLLVVPHAIQRAAAGADQPTDQPPLAGTLAAAGDRPTSCADRGATERADAGVLAHVDDLVLALTRRGARLRGRLVVAGVH